MVNELFILFVLDNPKYVHKTDIMLIKKADQLGVGPQGFTYLLERMGKIMLKKS